MAGHMGDAQVTVDLWKLYVLTLSYSLLVKGAVPGATGADVVVKPLRPVPQPEGLNMDLNVMVQTPLRFRRNLRR